MTDKIKLNDPVSLKLLVDEYAALDEYDIYNLIKNENLTAYYTHGATEQGETVFYGTKINPVRFGSEINALDQIISPSKSIACERKEFEEYVATVPDLTKPRISLEDYEKEQAKKIEFEKQAKKALHVTNPEEWIDTEQVRVQLGILEGKEPADPMDPWAFFHFLSKNKCPLTVSSNQTLGVNEFMTVRADGILVWNFSISSLHISLYRELCEKYELDPCLLPAYRKTLPVADQTQLKRALKENKAFKKENEDLKKKILKLKKASTGLKAKNDTAVLTEKSQKKSVQHWKCILAEAIDMFVELCNNSRQDKWHPGCSEAKLQEFADKKGFEWNTVQIREFKTLLHDYTFDIIKK